MNAYAVTRPSQYIAIFQVMSPMRVLLRKFRFCSLVALASRLNGSGHSRQLLLKPLGKCMYSWNELMLTLHFHLYRFASKLQACLAMRGSTKAGSKERSESTYKSLIHRPQCGRTKLDIFNAPACTKSSTISVIRLYCLNGCPAGTPTSFWWNFTYLANPGVGESTHDKFKGLIFEQFESIKVPPRTLFVATTMYPNKFSVANCTMLHLSEILTSRTKVALTYPFMKTSHKRNYEPVSPKSTPLNAS